MATPVTVATLYNGNIIMVYDISRRCIYGTLVIKVNLIKNWSVGWNVVNNNGKPCAQSSFEVPVVNIMYPRDISINIQPSTNQLIPDNIFLWR